MHGLAYNHSKDAGYAGVGSTGNATAAAMTDPRCSEVDAICNRMAEIIQMASVHAERLEQVEVRLTGGYPQKESTPNAPRPVPNGKLALMSAGLDEIYARISRSEEITSRLSQAI